MIIEKIEAPPCFDGSEGLIATIIRPSTLDVGTKFVSSQEDALQVGVLHHGKGWTSAPHRHSLSLREVKGGGEVLVISYGDVEVHFFDSSGKWVARSLLTTGNILIQHAGGHSFKALTDFRAVEVKQGPYVSSDKTYLPCKDKL